MAHVTADRVKETTISTGTGAITLLGAVTAHVSFATAGMVTGDTCFITIYSDNTPDWETSLATFDSSGPTLTRTSVISSSNSNAPVNFPAGLKSVILTGPASRMVQLDDSLAAQFPATLAADTPPSGKLSVYAKADGLYTKDSSGVETRLLDTADTAGTLPVRYDATQPTVDCLWVAPDGSVVLITGSA